MDLIIFSMLYIVIIAKNIANSGKDYLGVGVVNTSILMMIVIIPQSQKKDNYD